MIYSKDVLKFLQDIPENSADLIIADPPYGIEKDYGVEKSWSDIEEWTLWCEDWLAECNRILNQTGNILVYGIHNYLCYNQISLFKLGLTYRRQFIWHYENGFCGNRKLPRATYEPLLWFSKTNAFYFSEIREPYKSESRLKYKITKGTKVWKPHPDGRIAGDVWNIPTLAGKAFEHEKVDHPSQKPLLLSERLVKHFCPDGGMVVIPFSGSGSECLAAYQNNREFLATEINPYFLKIAEKRLESAGWTKPKDQLNKVSGSKFTVSPDEEIVTQPL